MTETRTSICCPRCTARGSFKGAVPEAGRPVSCPACGCRFMVKPVPPRATGGESPPLVAPATEPAKTAPADLTESREYLEAVGRLATMPGFSPSTDGDDHPDFSQWDEYALVFHDEIQS